jgi:NAD-dependent dihydropyrimidine dehydrogenase PreA subunit
MHQIVELICQGKATQEDIEFLEELAEVVKDASLCGLGQTAPFPLLSTLKYYKDEYDAHVYEKRCPAGVCKELIEYLIIEDKCTGCRVCAINCPQKCIAGEKKQLHVIDREKCDRCGICRDSCKFDAVIVK